MNDDELRARLRAAIAAPPVGSTNRLVEGARVRSLGGRRPRFAAVFAVALAVLVLALGAGGLIASLKASRGPAPVAPLGTASPVLSPPVESPPPVPSPSPSTAATPPSGQPLVVLPTSAEVIPAGANAVWVSIAGATGQLLFRSQDQGRTWVQRTLPSAGAGNGRITFVDASHGWYLSAGSPETQCAGQVVEVWRTADGAATWQSVGASGIGLTQCKDQISFVDQGTGFITASDQNGRPTVYRTDNGGNTWAASTSVADPPDQKTVGAGFALGPGAVRISPRFAGSELVVEGRGWQHLYVYRSTDGGATWAWAATIPGANDVDEVAFRDAFHWWLSGPSFGPNYRVTSDGGAHYTPAPGAPDSAAPIAPVFTFSDLNTGYATVRGTIWRTGNGGGNWALLQTPGT